MSGETKFICQTYRREEKGKGRGARQVLVQGTPIECASAGEAEARAHKMFAGGSHAGIDAYSVTVDVEMGDYGEPEFLVRLGDVPDEE